MGRGNPNFQPWTDSEIEFLRVSYPQYGGKYVAERMSRSIHAIRMKAMELGIRSQTVKQWTDEDNRCLKKYYPKKGAAFVAEKLGRSIKSVIAQTVRLGIRREHFKRWQEWEIRYQKRHYGTKSVESIARTLGRTVSAVQLKAAKLNIAKEPAKSWSEEEKKLLRELYPNPKISIASIAQQLGRPEKGVVKQARKLMLPRNVFWTKEQHQFLARNYKRMTHQEIAARIGRTEESVSHYASRMGLVRQPKRNEPQPVSSPPNVDTTASQEVVTVEQNS